MKKVKKLNFIVFVLLSCVCSIPSIAQDSTFSTQIKPFSIGLKIGYSSNFASGEANEGIKQMIQEFEDPQKENLIFNGKKTPKLSPIIRAFVDYQFKDKLSFRGGIQYTRRGFNIKVEGEEKDEEFQFDHKFTYKEKLRLTTIELPLSALFIPNDKMYFNGGLLFGIGISNSAKMKVSMNREVIINGELSEELSEGMTSRDINLNENAKNPYLGLFASIGYELYSNLYLEVAVLKTTNYMELDYGKLSDISLSIGLNYSLFDF